MFSSASTRKIEAHALASSASGELMQCAGQAVGQLAIAYAPHARSIWIACGPGNNGGDGFAAAVHLQRLGKSVLLTEIAPTTKRSAIASHWRQQALEAGAILCLEPPTQFDLGIDALFGLGKHGNFDARCQSWIAHLNASAAPTLAVDTPSGLNADTGTANFECVRADLTLSLLTLKPGLFTADGRAVSGYIWFNSLNTMHLERPVASLSRTPQDLARLHNTHKGSYGDVAVVGGDAGMAGAAILAGQAALFGGAGRVFVGLLSPSGFAWDTSQPELMLREADAIATETMTVVAGCGGGAGIAGLLEGIVRRAQKLVLDADALNHLIHMPQAIERVCRRHPHTTVMTPHPLEAARMLEISVVEVQRDRLRAAQQLADRWQCTVALKGSGTVIAAPHTCPVINPTGNARLAVAGTGDVLAGLIGSRLAQGQDAFEATCDACFRHGEIADRWPANGNALTAGRLAQAL